MSQKYFTYPSVQIFKILFRGFILKNPTKIRFSAQDHAVLLLLPNAVGFFISARQKSAWWKWFVPKLYQHRRGILEGPALKYFYMIHRDGRMWDVIFWSKTSHLMCVMIYSYLDRDWMIYATWLINLAASPIMRDAIFSTQNVAFNVWHGKQSHGMTYSYLDRGSLIYTTWLINIAASSNLLCETSYLLCETSYFRYKLPLSGYGVASISRFLKITGLLCKRAL